MPYATLSDVQDQAPKLQFGATTRPTLEDAQKIVARVNDHVDAVLHGLGYVTPVVGPKSIEILKDIVVAGATAKLLKAMFYGLKSPEEVGANDAWKEFAGKLRSLSNQDDPLSLPDADIHEWALKGEAEIGSHVIDPAIVVGDLDVDGFSETSGRLTRNQVF